MFIALYKSIIVKVVRGKTWNYYYLNSKWDKKEIRKGEKIVFIW